MKTLSVFAVALHPEGVDRNTDVCEGAPTLYVALHPEGVDRNWTVVILKRNKAYMVALHPEGVDRNPNLYDIPLEPERCRPPPGGRG